jgi:glycosyltransferase involved in cell wall biosynthesis
MAGLIERRDCEQHPDDPGAAGFSVVIPAFNEEAYLPRLLDSIDRARERYAGSPNAVEVIVADDGSTDSTAAVARARGCRAVAAGARHIARARNAGARAASGHVLAFVDADSQIHPDTFNEIQRLMDTGRVVGGTTGAVFERQSAGLRCTRAALALFGVAFRGWRAIRHRGMDTGVVFCAKADFDAIGGYREEHRWGEDVWFLFDLMRHGWRSGRRLEGATSTPAVFSTRKFDRYGDWHYFTMPFRIFWEGLRGRDTTAHRYWYGERPSARQRRA